MRRSSPLTSDLQRWLDMHSTNAHDHRTAGDLAAGGWASPVPPPTGHDGGLGPGEAPTLADLVRPAADDLARRALGLYGGAGSLTDRVLWQDGQVAADMELVDTLRSLLHHLAVQLR